MSLPPPLKWAGGKRWLVPTLLPLWHAHLEKHPDTRLVEPFCGGLAVALGLKAPNALLNDINPHLINFYQWVQKGLQPSVLLENEESVYYAHRATFNELTQANKSDSQQSASLFYYLNRTGYNGLCRFNKSGGFNVPFGRYKTINYKTDFGEYQNQLGQWTFNSGSFQDLSLAEGDFVYADPPYDVEFRQYAQQGFDWEDQIALAHWLAEYEGVVIASNQATPRILELYGDLGFDIDLLNAPRMISCKADGRKPTQEMLAKRNITS